MKTAKRILTVALALMLIFALAAPSFAIVSGNQPTAGGNSYYVLLCAPMYSEFTVT